MAEIISFTCKHNEKEKRKNENNHVVYARRNQQDRTVKLVSMEVKITLRNTLTGFLFDEFGTTSGNEFNKTMAKLERSTEGR